MQTSNVCILYNPKPLVFSASHEAPLLPSFFASVCLGTLPPCFFSFCPSSCNFIKKLLFGLVLSQLLRLNQFLFSFCPSSCSSNFIKKWPFALAVPAPKAGRFSKEARSLDLSHGQFHMTPHKEFISGQATFSKNLSQLPKPYKEEARSLELSHGWQIPRAAFRKPQALSRELPQSFPMAFCQGKSSVRRFCPGSRKLCPGSCKSSPAPKASRIFLGFPELRRHAPRGETRSLRAASFAGVEEAASLSGAEASRELCCASHAQNLEPKNLQACPALEAKLKGPRLGSALGAGTEPAHFLIKLQELGQNEKGQSCVSPDRQKPPNVLTFFRASSSRVHGFDFGCRGLSICETCKP